MPIAAVIARHSAALLADPDVVGVAQGSRNGKDVIQILVTRRTDSLASRLPAELEGYPVEIVESGEIRARVAPPSRRH